MRERVFTVTNIQYDAVWKVSFFKPHYCEAIQTNRIRLFMLAGKRCFSMFSGFDVSLTLSAINPEQTYSIERNSEEATTV